MKGLCFLVEMVSALVAFPTSWTSLVMRDLEWLTMNEHVLGVSSSFFNSGATEIASVLRFF